MNYELLNIINPADIIWQRSQKRLAANRGTAIMLAPNPGMALLHEQTKIKMLSVVDSVTKQVKYKTTKDGYFFNAVPTIDLAEVFMNKDGSISIVNDGQTVGEIKTYGGTRRIVKEVIYLHPDGTKDHIEEYTSDGRLYSNLFYARNEIQEIDFYDAKKFAPLRFFFYQGNLNYIRLYDRKTHAFIKDYHTVMEYYRDQLKQIVSEKDKLSISFMGVELLSLAETKSENTLYLNESPLDESGHLKGNLFQILTNQITYIHHVVMTQAMADEVPADVPTDKIIIVDSVA